jgi:O-antigen/teichoic acid export membrane protein
MSKFVANVIKLGSATLLGQIIGILVTPVLSRLYSPADFGIFQLFFSIVSLIAIVSCLSYQSAINLTKKDEDAANIVVLCFSLIIVTSLLSTVLFFIFSGYIEHILNAPGLSNYLLLLPLAIIANSVAYVLGSWLSRRQQFGTIAKGNLYSSITGKASSIGIGIISPSPFGLIFGTIINDATIVAVLLQRSFRDFRFFQKVTYEKIIQLARRYENFPRYNALSALVNTAGVQSTPLIIALFFSPIIVGYYAIAHMVIILPSKLMGNSITTLFYQKACEEKNCTGGVKNVVKMVHTRLISLGMFLFLILIIIGPELFSLALGKQWTIAGIYAQILAPWVFIVFLSGPLSSIFSVLEKQSVNLGFTVALLITRIVVIVIGGLLNDPILCMILLSGTGVIFWSWMNMYLVRMAGLSIRNAMGEIFRYLVFGISVCLPLLVAKYLSVSHILLLVIAGAVTIFYYSVVVYRDTELKAGLVKILENIRH